MESLVVDPWCASFALPASFVVSGLRLDLDYGTMSIDESNLDPRFACARCHTESQGLGRFGVGHDGKLPASFSYRGRER